MLVERLLSHRFQIIEAGDGLQGIEKAKEHLPDLVLVDMHMPHLTGYEVATRLKSLMPQMPVVALTADVTAHIRERVLAAGCDGYLSKPIDPDKFEDQIQIGRAHVQEELEDDSFRQAYQQKLVARLEEKVRSLVELNEQNKQLLEKAERRARRLEAGAKVGRNITSILDLDALLNTTVDVICDEFEFYYAGVFMVDEGNQWAVLQAGRGEPGAAMLAEGHKLKLDGSSMISTAIGQRRAQIASDVSEEPVHATSVHLPHTRSEMALPLIWGDDVIGALTVQSTKEDAFTGDDVTSLQAMADQLAVAIRNARSLKELEATHAELTRAKTFEAIATATGEAIHWVGNKAAPIPGSVNRVSEDIGRYLVLANALLEKAPPDLQEHKFAQSLAEAAQELSENDVDLQDVRADLEEQPARLLRRTLSMASIYEDLGIIESSARAILSIKEDLIGPARKRKIEVIDVAELLEGVVASMGIRGEDVRTLFTDDFPTVRADRRQLGRVFINLIKNAMEAMAEVEDKKLFIWGRQADDPGFIVVDVIDNGVGVPPEELDKIWMPFYTTKGSEGGTGLGLPACAQVIEQLGGKILVDSEVGLGTTFSVFLPAPDKQFERI